MIHERWIAKLTAMPPEGVPAGEGPSANWPTTFGALVAGKPEHHADETGGHCLQCGGCRFYVPLDGKLGGDWGACSNPASEYDARVVFEHWTCKEFRQ
ncbi:MAG TPA: DUF3027 domain-containing protein [Thermoanaerobaculia bacterium]|jgi:hypothetical protein|nr:DUF3027 domain-containing protein [Thermoanaerobaculia bacterium]